MEKSSAVFTGASGKSGRRRPLRTGADHNTPFPDDQPLKSVLTPPGHLRLTGCMSHAIVRSELSAEEALLDQMESRAPDALRLVVDLPRPASHGQGSLDLLLCPGDERRPARGGRPKANWHLPLAPIPKDGVLRLPADGGQALALEAIMARAWQTGGWGYPEYRKSRGRIAGSIAYIPPGMDREVTPSASEPDLLCRQLFAAVAAMSSSTIQLFMFVSNAWMTLPHPEAGMLLTYRRYAQARGLDMH